MTNGEPIDARKSQGLVNQPQAEVNQHFGEKKAVDTGGGDAAGGNLDKSTQIVNNFFLLGGKAVGAESQQSLQGLSQLLGQFGDFELIRRAYRDSLPADASVSRSEVASYGDMVAQLQEFRRLPEFIQRLVQDEQVPQAVHDQLKDATQPLSQAEDWKPSVFPTATFKPLQSYLQIVLRPDRSTNGFVINGSLIPDDHVLDPAKRFQPLDVEEQRKGASCQFEEIPTVLDQFLNLSLQQLTGKRYDLTIEIFLPLDYLCTGIDGWKLADSFFEGESYIIGTKYRIVVRSQERLEPKYRNSERMNQWLTNWERVRLCWHKPPSDSDFEHLNQLETCNWKQVQHRLEAEKLGLKLTCGLNETQKKNLFKYILMAATPVALWARCNCSHWDQVTEMNELLLESPLLKLSEVIWKKRIAADLADKPEDHLGSHLALLWEDPYRLTPDALVQLTPPG